MTIVNSCNSVNAFELDNSTCPELKCREYKFTQKDKIIIGCAFLSKTCSAADLAAQYNCHISYIYRLAELANTFLDAYLTEEDDEGEKVYGLIPLTKRFIKVSAVALRTICQASLEDTSIFIREIYGYHICTSTISNICSEAAVRADEFNRSVLLSNVCVGANDEIFFGQAQKMMILAGVCLRSTYIYAMELSSDRKAETWQTVMLCLQDQGLDLQVSISDAGASLIKGVSDAFPNCRIQLDVFHDLKDLGAPVIALERKAYALIGELDRLKSASSGPRPREKTKAAYHDLAQEFDNILTYVDMVLILSGWVRELLDFSGYNRIETENLLFWIVSEMKLVIKQCKECKHMSAYKLSHAVDTFNKRIVKSLSFLEAFYDSLDASASKMKIDPEIPRLVYRLRAIRSGSPEYTFMNKQINRLCRKNKVTRESIDLLVSSVLDLAERASSFIENVNSRLRTALNDFRGMTNSYLKLLQLYMNNKEYRRSEIPERVGKSPYELLTGKKASFIQILFPGFSPQKCTV